MEEIKKGGGKTITIPEKSPSPKKESPKKESPRKVSPKKESPRKVIEEIQNSPELGGNLASVIPSSIDIVEN